MPSMDALRALRTQAGLSQNALATAIDRSHTYIWNVEAGRVKLTARETIEVWAEALGVHPDAVYKAIGSVPHDIIELLVDADLATWQSVRHVLVDANADDQHHPGCGPVPAATEDEESIS